MENSDKIRTELFEAHYPEIKNEIEKRRRKWQLKALPFLDFDDISQVLMRHVYIKIDQFNIEKGPFVNWLNTLISNQMYNIFRNNLYSISRPCLNCACSLPPDGCELYGEQTNKCVLYKHWEQTKKSAHDIRLPLPSENHIGEIFNIPGENIDYEKAAFRLHEEMKKRLKQNEWVIYEMLFIFHLTDTQVAKKMRWVSTEGRKPGYGNLARLKKIFLQKAHKIKEETDLF